MTVTKSTLDVVEEYHSLQRKIDHVDRLVSQLKKALKPKKRDKATFLADWIPPSSRSSFIDENLGADLLKPIGPDLIRLLEAERVKLLAEQNLLEPCNE